jgi:hypothetical protein
MERLEHLANHERARARNWGPRSAGSRAAARPRPGSTPHRGARPPQGRLALGSWADPAGRDLPGRALRDLEKKSGLIAERTELSAEEAAASDRSVEERSAAEAAELARRTQPLEALPPEPAPVEGEAEKAG